MGLYFIPEWMDFSCFKAIGSFKPVINTVLQFSPWCYPEQFRDAFVSFKYYLVSWPTNGHPEGPQEMLTVTELAELWAPISFWFLYRFRMSASHACGNLINISYKQCEKCQILLKSDWQPCCISMHWDIGCSIQLVNRYRYCKVSQTFQHTCFCHRRYLNCV